MKKYCPECHELLVHKRHKIFHCWVCPNGHGTLYPSGELEDILKAVSGLGNVEPRIWNDRERYSAIQSALNSPEGNRLLVEIHDKDYPSITVYGDPETHSLWLHTGEEEKLAEYLEIQAQADSVGTYLKLAAEEAVSVFDDEVPLSQAAGHTLTALKLLGERILRAFPYIPM